MTDVSPPAHSTPATIRAAEPNDWERVAALLSTSALPVEGARDHLGEFVLAERDGTVVGCAAVERYGDAGLLRSVAVSPSERGQGTGATLVQQCLRDASRSGVRTLVLLTTTAERYFPRFGFAVVTRDSVPPAVRASAEFQGACPASATVMQLALSASQDPVTVRRARPNDAVAVAAIYNAGIRGRGATFETRQRTPEELAARLTGSRHPVLVAEREGRVVGWIAASSYRERDCYAGIAEFSVYVDTNAQGRRIGDALMRDFIPALEAAGFWKVLSRIFPENEASRALCRRHGFREVGVYEKHAKLDGIWRDVIIVERLLGKATE